MSLVHASDDVVDDDGDDGDGDDDDEDGDERYVSKFSISKTNC